MSDDRRCLVVDGHALVRIGVRELLSDRFEVEGAADLDGAIDVVTGTGSFDVAVVELDPAAATDARAAGPAVIRAMRKAMPGAGIVAHARRAERHSATEAWGLSRPMQRANGGLRISDRQAACTVRRH